MGDGTLFVGDWGCCWRQWDLKRSGVDPPIVLQLCLPSQGLTAFCYVHLWLCPLVYMSLASLDRRGALR